MDPAPLEIDALSLGRAVASTWTMAFVAMALLHGLFRFFFRPRKIQSTPWSRRIFLHELFFSALNACIAGTVIGFLSATLSRAGLLTLAPGPAPWTAVVLEVGLYFFAFDLYFYAMHRLMHTDRVYRFVHSVHHRSTSPGPLTAFSFHPFEAILTGSFVPLFLTAVEVHPLSLQLIVVGLGPVMSMIVHSGHEVFPSWWYRSRLTSWLLTPMFHDQHHQLYHCNYGAFTTIWDRVFGTVNPSFEADFAQHKARLAGARAGAASVAG